MNKPLNENKITESIERNAEWYAKRYRPQMEALENHSPLARARQNGITQHDVCNLGSQLAQFDAYVKYLNEEGSLSDLGKLPQVAVDVITASFGSSILPVISSIQPIPEERGIIYFKELTATKTRGNVQSGDAILTGREAPDVFPAGYANEKLTEVLATTSGGATNYTGNFPSTPVRQNTVRIEINGITIADDGDGRLSGTNSTATNVGFGTIDYVNGAYSITFDSAPPNGQDIVATFGTDFESSQSIPKITTQLTSTDIEAETFVLAQDTGIFKNFVMQQRFGRLAEDDMIQDLSEAIVAEVDNEAVRRIANAAPATALQWDKNPPVGVSWTDHKEELAFRILESEGEILQAAGRGQVSYVLCGPKAFSIVSSLKGFESEQITSPGPQIGGMLNGKPVIRTPFLPTNKIYPVYKGPGLFEAPIVDAPFMPLFLDRSNQNVDNQLQKTGVAATMHGLKVVVPAFIGHINIQNI